MKILLIFPPLSMNKRYSKNVGNVGGHMPPLGLCYMAAVLERECHNVKIMDCPPNNYIIDNIMQEVDIFKPDLVGIACITHLVGVVEEITKLIQKKHPEIVTLIGGPHINESAEDALKQTNANIAMKGETEITIVEIVKNLDSYRNKHQIVSGEKVNDLNSLPMPARHLLSMEKYTALPNTYKRYPEVGHMITSRGCPFTCTFCADANSGYRQRSVDKVIEEIKLLQKEYGVKEIAFWDDIFPLNKKWVMEFCKRIIDGGIKINWSCYSRVDLLDEELIKAMKSAGCWNMFLGLESGDQEVINNIKKRTTLDQIREKIKLLKKAGIEVRGSFVLGLPGETPEKARKTIEFAIELEPDYAQFTLATPFPGTELYNTYKKWGKLEKKHDKYNEWSPVFVPFGYKDAEELTKIHKEAFRRFYFRPRYIIGRLRKLNSFGEIKRLFVGLRMVLGFVK